MIPKSQGATVTTIGPFLEIFSTSSVAFGTQIPLIGFGKGAAYISFIPIYDGEELKLFFNSSLHNAGVVKIDDLKNGYFNYKRSQPSLFKITNEGDVQRFDIDKNDHMEVVFMPGVYHFMSDHEMIIYASKKKKNRFSRVKID